MKKQIAILIATGSFFSTNELFAKEREAHLQSTSNTPSVNSSTSHALAMEQEEAPGTHPNAPSHHSVSGGSGSSAQSMRHHSVSGGSGSSAQSMRHHSR